MSAASISAKDSASNGAKRVMALGPRLDLRQTQSLVMTPQLQQAIRLLALSNVELEAAVMEELDRNPLLEIADSEGESAAPLPEAANNEFGDAEPAADTALSGEGNAGDALDADFAGETYHHDSAADGGPGMDGSLGLDGTGGGGEIDFDLFAGALPSLYDHLMEQAASAFDPAELPLARALLDDVDEAGYFSGNLLLLSQRMNVPLVRVERALEVIQSFDPTGVGAQSLGECLALQAKEADRYDPCMAALLDRLDWLAEGKLSQLKRVCGVDDEDLADMIRELRAYDPKPGLKFSSETTHSITPDVFVARRGSGWAIELNSATLPRVVINRSYYSELATGKQNKQSSAWLSECMANANWLTRALDQRQRTIIRVATEVVKQQEAFFLNGVEHLRPLTLRTIADAIEMHESTVSRVTSNKYLSCERGVFELKFFFTSGVGGSDGVEGASAEAVKSRIKALISAEAPDAILSDDTLVEMLKGEGFELARRTVAKYREAIGLGSSVQRRRQKAISARAA
jgi:RNA polymerase sigma-54 factor